MPPHVYITMWKYLRNASPMFTPGFSNRSSVEAAMTGRRCVFLGESKSTSFGLPKVDGIIKITYNRTEMHLMDEFREPRRGNNSDFAMTIWHFWFSDCMFCYQYLKIGICCWLFKCGVLCERGGHITAQQLSCVCVCVCVRESGRHGHTTAACVQTHKSFITTSVMWLFPSQAWTDGKTKDIINRLYFHFKSWIIERGITFPTWLVVFGQSQCTGSVAQSEQTVLVGRRDIVENKAFERGGA